MWNNRSNLPILYVLALKARFLDGIFYQNEAHRANANQLWLFGAISYAATMLAAKVSICFMLLRLTANRVQKIILYIILFLMSAVAIVGLFWVLFQCRPVSAFWKKTENGVCHTQAFIAVTYLHAGVGLVSDWALAVMPFFILWITKLNTKTKIGTAFALSLGALYVTVRLVWSTTANTKRPTVPVSRPWCASSTSRS